MDLQPAATAATFPESSAASPRAFASWAWLTREAGLWIGVAALALIPRALNLERAPLTDSEAGLALQAAAFVRGESASFANPLLGALQAALFALFGPRDGAARVVAALAGAGLCLAPILMRRELGASRALFFGALLAVSPTLWFVSRQATGGALAWALAVAAWWCWRSRRTLAAGLAAGLLLACGVDAVAPALVALAAWVAGRGWAPGSSTGGLGAPAGAPGSSTGGLGTPAGAPGSSTGGLGTPAGAPGSSTGGLGTPAGAPGFSTGGLGTHLGAPLLAAIAGFLAGATAFGWRLEGVADAFNGYAQWVGLLTQDGPLSPLRGLAGVLLLEPLIWLAAPIGLAILAIARLAGRAMARPGDSAAAWLAWIGAGLLLFLAAGSRQADGLAPVVFGGAALAASAWSAVARLASSQDRWSAPAIVAGIALIMLVYAFLGFLQYAGQGLLLWLLTAAIAAAMVAGVAIVGTLTYGLPAAAGGVGAALGACLLVYTLAAGIQLNHTRPDNPAEPYVVAPASADIRQMVAAVEQMAVRARGDPGSLPLRVAETAPASLRWALRGQRQLAVSTQPGSAEAALLPAGASPQGASPQGASPQGAFIGRAFTTSSSASLAPARCDWTDGQVSCLGLARWLAFREAGAATPSQWVLWISPDLARRISGQP